MIPNKMAMTMQVNTEPTISRSIKLIVRPGPEEGGMRPSEKVSGDYFQLILRTNYFWNAQILAKIYKLSSFRDRITFPFWNIQFSAKIYKVFWL